MSGTRVTATDVETGESESAVIENNYIVIVDGDRYVSGTKLYSNGTAVITIKKREVTR